MGSRGMEDSNDPKSAREQFIGRDLLDLPTPCLIVDRAIVARNCRQMLTMCDKAGVAFRAHIKTHKAWFQLVSEAFHIKCRSHACVDRLRIISPSETYENLARQITVEATELMVGGPASQRPVDLIVSTTLELKHIAGWLGAQQQKSNRRVNVLYGIPLPPSRISELSSLSTALGPDSISVMIDHPSQLDVLVSAAASQTSSFCPRAFIKIDTGYHRAGVPGTPESASLRTLLRRMREVQEAGRVKFQGFYSHGGDSYGVDSPTEAFAILGRELRGVGEAAKVARTEGLAAEGSGNGNGAGYVLSVGATPTISVAWMNADAGAAAAGQASTQESAAQTIARLQQDGHVVEFHAGNYPILDVQQLATAAGASSAEEMPSAATAAPRRPADLAMTVLAEVNSVYSERPFAECLVAAGCLALGREPCKSYEGWGVVADWPTGRGEDTDEDGMAAGVGWYLHSISQEHGRMRKGAVPGVTETETSEEDGREDIQWKVGDRVRIWPNHACIAAANYPRIMVVDGDDEATRGRKVVEVWSRCVGW